MFGRLKGENEPFYALRKIETTTDRFRYTIINSIQHVVRYEIFIIVESNSRYRITVTVHLSVEYSYRLLYIIPIALKWCTVM